MSGRGKQAAALLVLCALLLCACVGGARTDTAPPGSSGSMELIYAQQFGVDYYADGCALITIAGDERYLLLPPGMADSPLCPEALRIRQPLDGIYLAASSAMDLFVQLGALDRLRLTSTRENNWALPEVVRAMEEGRLLYAGKYSAPDFELLLAEGCPLAIESTMLFHSPEIREKLEELGIGVLVERSSYESHPLGRLEWIRLYGLLLGLEDEAEAFFRAQLARLEAVKPLETEKRVAFFHINSSGAAVVRRSGDYVSKMIELAGGRYLFDELGAEDTALSTVNMQMESFYAAALDADVLIYNSAIDGELKSLDELLEKAPLLKQSRAVQNGEVWCTGQNMFQQSSAAAAMIAELHAVLGEEDPEGLAFLYKLD